jgi:hypothetical protein
MRRWLERRGSDRIDLTFFEDRIDRDVRAFKFNKVVSGFMEFYNRHKTLRPDGDTARRIEEILRVFAPGFRAGCSEGEGSGCASRREMLPDSGPRSGRDRSDSAIGMLPQGPLPGEPFA